MAGPAPKSSKRRSTELVGTYSSMTFGSNQVVRCWCHALIPSAVPLPGRDDVQRNNDFAGPFGPLVVAEWRMG
jgi:hypothetical protein